MRENHSSLALIVLLAVALIGIMFFGLGDLYQTFANLLLISVLIIVSVFIGEKLGFLNLEDQEESLLEQQAIESYLKAQLEIISMQQLEYQRTNYHNQKVLQSAISQLTPDISKQISDLLGTKETGSTKKAGTTARRRFRRSDTPVEKNDPEVQLNRMWANLASGSSHADYANFFFAVSGYFLNQTVKFSSKRLIIGVSRALLLTSNSYLLERTSLPAFASTSHLDQIISMLEYAQRSTTTTLDFFVDEFSFKQSYDLVNRNTIQLGQLLLRIAELLQPNQEKITV